MREMLHNFAAAAIVVSMLLGGADLASGQQNDRQDNRGANQGRTLERMIDAKVMIQGDQEFGNVMDVMVNRNGCVEYLVVSRGGQADSFTLVPWAAGDFNRNQNVFVLDMTQQRMQQLPTFTRDRLRNISEQQTRQILQAFNIQNARQQRGSGAAESQTSLEGTVGEWRNHDGYWMYWHDADNRWYYTDGQQWYFHGQNRWSPYRFDREFGRGAQASNNTDGQIRQEGAGQFQQNQFDRQQNQGQQRQPNQGPFRQGQSEQFNQGQGQSGQQGQPKQGQSRQGQSGQEQGQRGQQGQSGNQFRQSQPGQSQPGTQNPQTPRRDNDNPKGQSQRPSTPD